MAARETSGGGRTGEFTGSLSVGGYRTQRDNQVPKRVFDYRVVM